MAKKKDAPPDVPPSNRKTPVRNPIRKLHMDKARLEYRLSELYAKFVAEDRRHANTIDGLSSSKADLETTLSEISQKLVEQLNPKLDL